MTVEAVAKCLECGAVLEGRSDRAKWCSERCRKAHSRRAEALADAPALADVPDDTQWARCARHEVEYVRVRIPGLPLGEWLGCCPECDRERALQPKVEQAFKARHQEFVRRCAQELDDREGELQELVDAAVREQLASLRADLEHAYRAQLRERIAPQVEGAMRTEILEELRHAQA